MMLIVPNELRDAINRKLDEALKEWPAATEQDRDVLYHELLNYFNETGEIPDFKVTKREKEAA